MKKFVRRVIEKLGGIAFENLFDELGDKISNSQEIQVLLTQHYKSLLAGDQRPLPSFEEVGFRCHSQFEEDGILLYLFSIIGATNRTAVEICAGDGIQCNTANLIINHGWKGFLFDGELNNVEKGQKYYAANKKTFLWPPAFTQAWITAENVNEILKSAGVQGKIDLLSLDIDGMDYWVWKAIDCIQPRVIVCETHNVIPSEKALTVPYDAGFVVKTPDYHSASLAAMAKLAAEKGYRLVGTHRYGFNAFFVRNGIADGLLPAVSAASCLQHPYSKHARDVRWPKVKDLKWIEV